MASLFQGAPLQAPSYAATTTDVPKWLQDYTVDLFSQQRAVAGTPYQPYALPRIAETTAPTTQAQNLVQSSVGAYQPAVGGAIAGTQGLTGPNAGTTAGLGYLQQAAGMSGVGAAQPYLNTAGQTATTNIGQYMNPYTQNVTDQIASLGARNLSENLLPQVSDQFIRAGQFGSSGMGTFGGRALRDTQEAILNEQNKALQAGYTQALGASQTDLARQAQLASTAGQLTQAGQQNLGTIGTQTASTAQSEAARQQAAQQQVADLARMQQGLTTADAAALESVGLAQQQQQQRGLDVAYQDYQNQIQYPQTQINNMSTTLRGLPPTAVPTTGTTSGYTTTFAPSPLSGIAAAYGTYKGLTSSGGVFAKGGLVQGYAEGGAVSGGNDDALHASVMADYGQYFNTGGAAPGYADDGLVDTENPADLVAPTYSSPPQRQVEPSGGGYAPPPQTAAGRLASINPELAALMDVYNVGAVDYTDAINTNRKDIATERAAYKSALADMAKTGVASGPSEAEKWFKFAAAYADPGKTGSFLEGTGHAATAMAEHRAEQRKADAANALNKAQYGFKGHEVDLESLRDEGKTLQSLQSEQTKGRLAIIQDVIKESISAGKKPPAWATYELYQEQEKAAGRKPLDWDAYRLEGESARGTKIIMPETKGETKYDESFGAEMAKRDSDLMGQADAIPKQLATSNRVRELLKQNPITGVGAEALLGVNNVLSAGGMIDPKRGITTQLLVSNLASEMLANVKASGLGTGQGFTDKDAKLLAGAVAGTIELNAATLLELANISDRVAAGVAQRYNSFVKRTSPKKREFYGIQPMEIPGAVAVPEPAFH